MAKSLDDRILDDEINSIKKIRDIPQPHQRKGDLLFPNAKTKAKELTSDTALIKFLESGPRDGF